MAEKPKSNSSDKSVFDPARTLLDSIKDVVVGSIKGSTTDIIDLAKASPQMMLSGAVYESVTGKKTPTGDQIFEGATSIRPSGSIEEFMGSFLSPGTGVKAAKAMVVGALALPKRWDKYLKHPLSSMSSPADQATVFSETGVYRDIDKKFKTIISDQGATLKDIPGAEPGQVLSDVLHHKELFDIYPQLKTIPVEKNPMLGHGSIKSDNSKMTIGIASVDHMLGTILHETQHAIQNIEGFAKGNNPRSFLSYDPDTMLKKLKDAKSSSDSSVREAAERFSSKVSADIHNANTKYLNTLGEQEARYTAETKGFDIYELSTDVKALISRGKSPQTYDFNFPEVSKPVDNSKNPSGWKSVN